MNPPKLPESKISLTYTQPSTPPHLTYTPLTHPGPQELIVKIKAASINPVDIQFWGSPLIGWLAGKKEKGIGHDYSGEVVAVGEKVEKDGKWKVGDEVYGLCNRPTGEGTFTTHLTLTPSTCAIAHKPSTLSHTASAAIPLVALTAFACLDWLPAATSRPRSVIVAGASGGVGSWCVQLAKKVYGCHVIGICSGRNAEYVRGLGADQVVDYEKGDVVTTLLGSSRLDGRKYDLYVDCVGGTQMFGCWRELLGADGAYVTIVGDKTDRVALGGPTTYLMYPAQVLRYIRGYLFGPRYANIIFYEKCELLEKITELAEGGEVNVEVQATVKGVLMEKSHEEAWEALKEYMVGGRVRGKIVVDIA